MVPLRRYAYLQEGLYTGDERRGQGQNFHGILVPQRVTAPSSSDISSRRYDDGQLIQEGPTHSNHEEDIIYGQRFSDVRQLVEAVERNDGGD